MVVQRKRVKEGERILIDRGNKCVKYGVWYDTIMEEEGRKERKGEGEGYNHDSANE